MGPNDYVRRILEAIDSGDLTTERLVEATRVRPTGTDGQQELVVDLDLMTTERTGSPDSSTETATDDDAARQNAAERPTRVLDSDGRFGSDRSVGSFDGRYEVASRRHARGGIGEVWRARDRRLDRPVAIKRLRPDRLGLDATRIRFRREAQITARLQHPGIVPVFDLMAGGPEGGGGPWYTMRFVEGKTLAQATHEYHEANGGEAEFRRLIEALIAVCQTIAYAHAEDVLHRDIKGDNVILGDFGEVFVLDWGLAKQVFAPAEELAADPINDDPELTRPGSMIGTPAYMAPEVARGGPTTRRSDIYSLGAILYSILVGRPPYRGTTPEEIVLGIEQGPPEPPIGVNARIPRALDAICRKAMDREPEQRYAEAGELAEDLRRWLDDRPVSTCRDPWSVRAARWARKHRTIAASAVAVLLATVLCMATASVFLTRANRRTEGALTESEHRFRLARDVVGKMLDEVTRHDLPPIAEATALRHNLSRLAVDLRRNLAQSKPENLDLALDAAQAEVRAGDMARTYYDTQEAVAYYQQAHDRLRNLIIASSGPDEATIPRIVLASMLVGRADLEILRGTPAQAVNFLDEADRLVDPAAASRGDDPNRLHQVGRSRLSRAAVLEDQGRIDEARIAIDEARVALVRSAPMHRSSPILLILVEGHRAELQADANPKEARSIATRNVERTAQIRADRPSDDVAQHLHAIALRALGRTLLKLGDKPDAEASLAEAVTIMSGLVDRAHRLPRFLDDLAETQRELGQSRQGQTAEATLREAIANGRELVGRYPDIAEFRADLGLALAALATLNGDEPTRQEARRLLDQALTHRPNNPDLLKAIQALGQPEGP